MIKLRLYFPPQRRIIVYNIFNISLKIVIKLETKLALNIEWHGNINYPRRMHVFIILQKLYPNS